MKFKARWLTAAAAAFLALSSIAIVQAGQAAKVDVTGAWVFTVTSDAGTTNPAVTLKQDGEKITGHYSSQLFGEADLAGTVKGQTIAFIVSAEIQGMKIELKYDGTIESNTSMKGTLSAGDLGGGTFTAVKK
jgi:hypothetical protein